MASYAKAVLAAAIAGLGAVVTGLGDNSLSAQEIATAALAAVVALGAVYGVSNKA